MQDASRAIWFKKEEVKTETIQTDSFNFNNVKTTSCNASSF
jgi:hypothetical protein